MTARERRVCVVVGYIVMATVTFSAAAVISPGLAGVLFCLVTAGVLGWFAGYREALRRVSTTMMKEIESDAAP